MPVSIDSCPGCKAPVLPDTVVCPSCGEVLKDDDAQLYSEPKSEEVDIKQGVGLVMAEMEDACPSCGTMVRSGLVKCWNCKSFMKKEVAELYERQQTNPQKITYSETDREDYLPPRRDTDNGGTNGGSETFQAEAGDFDLNIGQAADGSFDLSPAAQAPAAQAGGFDLGPGVAAPGAPAAPAPAPSGGGFELSPAAATPAADAPTPAATEAPTEPVAETNAAETPAPEASSETPAAETKTTDDAATTETKSTDGEKSDDTDAPAADAAAPPAGDDFDLLSVALTEEKEFSALRKQRRRKKRESRGITGIVVFCPRGHRIEVPIRFAGKRGKCPKCKSTFSVPRPSDEERKKAEEEANVVKEPTVPWLWDVQIHELDPATLKLKAGSMKTATHEADLFLDENGIRIGTLVVDKKGKKLKVPAKKKDPVRESIREHLIGDLALKDLPVGDNELVKADDIQKLVIVQPTNAPEDSIFAGIPVFGEGRIAVRLTSAADGKQRFFSFELARFRQFSKQISTLYGINDFGQDVGIPLREEFESDKCHYSGDTVESLKDLGYYQTDSSYELNLVGRKCELCSIVVSEESRKKEKLGGASGRGIAKAKCPKCNGKFGKISLYSMDVKAEEESAEEEDATTAEMPAADAIASDAASSEKAAAETSTEGTAAESTESKDSPSTTES